MISTETERETWYLYQMVTQNTLRTHEGKKMGFEKKMCDWIRLNQMPSIDQFAEIALQRIRAHLFLSYYLI